LKEDHCYTQALSNNLSQFKCEIGISNHAHFHNLIKSILSKVKHLGKILKNVWSLSYILLRKEERYYAYSLIVEGTNYAYL
jgi:hypothetical protein